MNLSQIEGINEDLQVTKVHDVYPTIDPTSAYSSKSCKGKVVLITGTTGVIGAGIALAYAQAGANVILCGRNLEALEKIRNDTAEAAGDAGHVLSVQVDVVKPENTETAVAQGVAKFGRLDIVIANAGKAPEWGKPLAETNVDEWWDGIEVNLRGVYNIVRYSLPHVIKTKGYIIAITAMAAQLRIPCSSTYSISKHALNRFVEFVQLEHPEVHAFSLHPGAVRTPLALGTTRSHPPEVAKNLEGHLKDTVDLPACTVLYLTSGKADWLSGRYVSANWDLGEVETKYKTTILENNLLLNRLSVPLPHLA